MFPESDPVAKEVPTAPMSLLSRLSRALLVFSRGNTQPPPKWLVLLAPVIVNVSSLTISYCVLTMYFMIPGGIWSVPSGCQDVCQRNRGEGEWVYTHAVSVLLCKTLEGGLVHLQL